MPLRIGETFAGYRILRLLGSGGMGEVYLVQHPRLPRQEALKVLRPDISSDRSFRERFIREADLAAGLRHPHIVGIHDRGEHEGQLWIAMDYIDGTDAAHLLQQKYPAGMPIDVVVPVTNAVAGALDYAHKTGLLHRDVKPANIIVADPDGDDPGVFLADFGIARPIDDTSGITTTNMTVGTVAYAAPEQLMGESIDGRADQYALAASSYHLLTGVQLFPHSNPAVVISHHLNAPVPALADARPELAALDPVMAVALAKNRDGTFAACTDFARALSDHASSLAAGASLDLTRPAPTPRTQPAPGNVEAATASRTHRRPAPAIWIVTGAVAIAGIAAVTLALVHGGPNESVPTSANPVPLTASPSPLPTAGTQTSAPVPATQPPVVTTEPPLLTTTSPPPPPTTTQKATAAVAFGAVCSFLYSKGDQWPDGPYLHRWMLERYPDLPPNQVDNILETAFQDPACQGPVAH